ncbi:MAG: arginine repressor [Clostridia bacterium]|nr:arginine repressor [Clostridia bacterium]
MKNERQEKILELISKHEIETQDDMISKLRADGFNVTQATISRDMRELKLTKVLTARGTYKYTVNHSRNHSNNVKFNNAVVDSIISVDFAGNCIVLKTYPGLAQAVASGVDSLNISNILGCVGGDDTIIVVVRDAEAAKDISEKIRELMKTF